MGIDLFSTMNSFRPELPCKFVCIVFLCKAELPLFCDYFLTVYLNSPRAGVGQFIRKGGNLSTRFDPAGGCRFIQIDFDDRDALFVFNRANLS